MQDADRDLKRGGNIWQHVDQDLKNGGVYILQHGIRPGFLICWFTTNFELNMGSGRGRKIKNKKGKSPLMRDPRLRFTNPT